MVTMRRVVRAATPADIDAIVAIHVAAFRAGNVPHLPPELADRMTPERSRPTWRSLVEAGPRRGAVLVAAAGGEIGGVAAAGPSRDAGDDGGELYALYVDPARWSAGHGRALDAAARDHLRAQGFADAILWVLEANERARRFYERCGWEVEGERRAHLGATTIRYRVALEQPAS
jgi:ribosomal protein S18 acetylase RimI-like enzyme